MPVSICRISPRGDQLNGGSGAGSTPPAGDEQHRGSSGDPPSFAGAVHETVALWPDATALTPDGAPGAVAANV